MVIFINHGMVTYGGDLAVGAYGIANKVAFIFVMVNIGLNQGMQPIAGYNYGSQQLDRMLHVLKLSMIAGTIIMTSGFLVAMLLPGFCARLFTTDQPLIEMSIRGIRIEMLTFPIVGYQMVVTSFFQSIGKAKISMFLSLSRQLLFLLPMLIILPPLFKIDGVWAAMPVSDLIAAIVAGWIMTAYMKRFMKQHKELTNGRQENNH